MISTTVTQPSLATIRFQFWRDALAAIWGGGVVPQHPVAAMLAELRWSRPVQKYYLSQMIDVRVRPLSLSSHIIPLNESFRRRRSPSRHHRRH